MWHSDWSTNEFCKTFGTLIGLRNNREKKGITLIGLRMNRVKCGTLSGLWMYLVKTYLYGSTYKSLDCHKKLR